MGNLRAVDSRVLGFGLVSIPVKLYPAAVSEAVGFNLLHTKCGGRIKQQRFCPACKTVVEKEDLTKGFEVSKDHYVRFADEELEALAQEKGGIEILQFVPLASIDSVYFEKNYYLGADKGGDKPYRVLYEALEKSGKAGVAKCVMRGKENLVVVRPAQGVLMLSTMYYASEVRNASEVPNGESAKVSDAEKKLAIQLIDNLSAKQFDPEEYEDEYSRRVLEIAEKKVEGKKVEIAVQQPSKAKVVDLMSALSASLGAPARKPAKKAAVTAPAKHAARR